MSPQNKLLWYIDYFEQQVLRKQQMQGKAFSEFPYLPKDKSSKRNSVIMDSPSRSFIDQERLTLFTGEETRSGQHSQANFLPNYHTFHLFQGPSSFLKLLFTLFQETYILPPHFLLRWYLILYSEATYLCYSSPCVSLMYT